MQKIINKKLIFLLLLIYVFMSGVVFATASNDAEYVEGDKLITEHTFYTNDIKKGYSPEKEKTYLHKEYELTDVKYEKIGNAVKVIKNIDVKSKEELKKNIYAKNYNNEKVKLSVDLENLNWKKVVDAPKKATYTYRGNQTIPNTVNIIKNGKIVTADRVDIKHSNTRQKITAPAVFYGKKGIPYVFNNKLVNAGNSPVWNGYQKDILKYLNRRDIESITGGRWSSGYIKRNGRIVRLASYDAIRRVPIRIATFIENPESRTHYTAKVSYIDPAENGKYVIKATATYKLKENKVLKMVAIGIGLLIFAIAIAMILRFISRKKKNEVKEQL